MACPLSYLKVFHACPLSLSGDCCRVGEQNEVQADENQWHGKTRKICLGKLELGPFRNTKQLKRQLVNYKKKINI